MKKLAIAGVVFLLAASAVFAFNQGSVLADDSRNFRARLIGYNETPMSLSSPGSGTFSARLDNGTLSYRLTYSNLPTTATAAHIHLGQEHTTGGVIAFLCGGGDKPACPSPGGTVNGVVDAADVIGPAGQGIAAGEFEEAIRAMRNGAAYVNVHTTAFAPGEIRGQVNRGGGDDDDD